MSTQYDEDLFESTKMTFGEHLEELRGALLKSLVSIFLGFLVGLIFADSIVRWLQVPVESALKDHYQVQAAMQYIKELEERGLPVPEDADEIQRQMAQGQMISEPIYLYPPEIVAELMKVYPDLFGGVELPDHSPARVPPKDQMIRVFQWRSLTAYQPSQLTSLNAQEAFMIWIKAALVAGVVLSSPAVFYFMWAFVASGLYPHEKQYVHVFLPLSLALFLAGAGLAFFFVFKYVLKFLLGFNLWLGIDPDLRISEWISFALILPVGFGISFQLPLVMLFLERIGVFTVDDYLGKWRIAVLVISIISMLLTPADPMSMMLMFVPLTVLYFAGIGLCRLWKGGRSPFRDPID